MPKSLILVLIFAALSFANPMDQYESKRLIDRSRELNPYYSGPLVATGGAIANINRYIDRMNPVIVGHVTPQSITLVDSPEVVYTFKRVKTYTVVQEGSTFNVYYIRAKMKGERYDIIIELNDTDYYDRILRIYKEDKPHTLVLWRDQYSVELRTAEKRIEYESRLISYRTKT